MTLVLPLQTGSQGLRAILREKCNVIGNMKESDVKPLLQGALTTPAGVRIVDLDAGDVPPACIVEGEQALKTVALVIKCVTMLVDDHIGLSAYAIAHVKVREVTDINISVATSQLHRRQH